MQSFWSELRAQRWDDHRFYHHSTINQALHLASAITFLCAYALVFTHPAAAAVLGWLVAMMLRQTGHFFFEPRGYDRVNHATHEYKEAVKIGYNLRRKLVLMAIWAASPVVLWLAPTLFGVFPAPADLDGFIDNLGRLWIYIGVAALGFRFAQLCVLKDMQTGLVWIAKIATDPFHDVMLYYRAPLHLLRGELMDPAAGRPAR